MTTTELTTVDLEAGYLNADWLGFGYLGERRNQLTCTDPECQHSVERVDHADAAIVYIANQEGWTGQQLFDFTNSKRGRWYGDRVFGSDEDPIAAARAEMLPYAAGR